MRPLTLCPTLQGSRGDSSSRVVGLGDLLGKRLQTVIPWAGVSLQMNLIWPSQCGFFSFFWLNELLYLKARKCELSGCFLKTRISGHSRPTPLYATRSWSWVADAHCISKWPLFITVPTTPCCLTPSQTVCYALYRLYVSYMLVGLNINEPVSFESKLFVLDFCISINSYLQALSICPTVPELKRLQEGKKRTQWKSNGPCPNLADHQKLLENFF